MNSVDGGHAEAAAGGEHRDRLETAAVNNKALNKTGPRGRWRRAPPHPSPSKWIMVSLHRGRTIPTVQQLEGSIKKETIRAWLSMIKETA